MFGSARRMAQIQTDLARASEAGVSVDAWNDRAGRYARDCGCGTSAAFCVVTLIASVVLTTQASGHRIATAAAGVIATLMMAGVGKIAGLGFAQLRLALLGREVRAALKDRRNVGVDLAIERSC